jgi:hypothetical protein
VKSLEVERHRIARIHSIRNCRTNTPNPSELPRDKTLKTSIGEQLQKPDVKMLQTIRFQIDRFYIKIRAFGALFSFIQCTYVRMYTWYNLSWENNSCLNFKHIIICIVWRNFIFGIDKLYWNDDSTDNAVWARRDSSRPWRDQ